MAKTRVAQGEEKAELGLGGDRVHILVAKTINIGDYESLRVEYGETHVLKKGETHKSVRPAVFRSVTKAFSSMLDQVEKVFS